MPRAASSVWEREKQFLRMSLKWKIWEIDWWCWCLCFYPAFMFASVFWVDILHLVCVGDCVVLCLLCVVVCVLFCIWNIFKLLFCLWYVSMFVLLSVFDFQPDCLFHYQVFGSSGSWPPVCLCWCPTFVSSPKIMLRNNPSSPLAIHHHHHRHYHYPHYHHYLHRHYHHPNQHATNIGF